MVQRRKVGKNTVHAPSCQLRNAPGIVDGKHVDAETGTGKRFDEAGIHQGVLGVIGADAQVKESGW